MSQGKMRYRFEENPSTMLVTRPKLPIDPVNAFPIIGRHKIVFSFYYRINFSRCFGKIVELEGTKWLTTFNTGACFQQ